MCPSNRLTNTGVDGRHGVDELAGRQYRRVPQLVVPVAAEDPFARGRLLRPVRRCSLANSCGDGAWRKSTLSSCRPPPMKCTCESLNPGRTRAPPASITLVAGPRQAARSAVVPTAATRPPTMATASASGFEGTPVQTLALTMRRSATRAGRQSGRPRPVRRGQAGSVRFSSPPPARGAGRIILWRARGEIVTREPLAGARCVDSPLRPRRLQRGGRLRSLSTRS